MTGASPERHLGADEVAAYVDGALSAEDHARIHAHLATCTDCRGEVAEVVGLVNGLPTARRATWRIWVPAVAAAAVIAAVLVFPRDRSERAPLGGEHREGAVTTTVAPRPVAPAGAVATADTLIWSSVPSADRYRVRLFDAGGTVLWERETADTIATLPSSIVLHQGVSYYWRVEARTGFDRWAASDLIEFVMGRGERARR